ncbi:NAD(P)H-dependent oxidoreductase [Maribacter algarum]|uniref:NAD(P)H-dependent oxidoreductase n=1 Tax=Maribacter algarum (ex Zhang et al. 2020) TaxID=2578118 RepID=A0A5S3PUJ6_9FLAO|nr:NAD(P)H-dependent oxidoreductase [Maribacter algarum]TMM58643.1 NAD(P)H-dependent oxidoreductase [Maribacter algarum]
MNVLIVHAHENTDSFSSALARTVKSFFEENGHQVTISDLYGKGFNPVGGIHDFKNLTNSDYYKYAVEQINAVKENSFSEDVFTEMKLLEEADVLILNFPLWWFGMPAILKGWVDRVLAYGFAYGGEYGLYKEGRFQGKKAFLSITTGSPNTFYTEEGTHGRSLENILLNINEGIIGLVGFDVLQPYIAYSVSRISEEKRKKYIEDYHSFLIKNFG